MYFIMQLFKIIYKSKLSACWLWFLVLRLFIIFEICGLICSLFLIEFFFKFFLQISTSFDVYFATFGYFLLFSCHLDFYGESYANFKIFVPLSASSLQLFMLLFANFSCFIFSCVFAHVSFLKLISLYCDYSSFWLLNLAYMCFFCFFVLFSATFFV